MKTSLFKSKKSPLIKRVGDIGPVTFVSSARARKINLTVRNTGEVRVTVPKQASLRAAEEFVLSKEKWIKRHLLRVEDNRDIVAEYAEKLAELDLDKAVDLIVIRLEELAAEFGFQYGRVTIRNQKTRWGSCSMKNNLSLNIKLALLPDELRDLILVHELVHTEIKNHGPAFWRKLQSIYPDARELDRQVNRLGGLLRLPLNG